MMFRGSRFLRHKIQFSREQVQPIHTVFQILDDLRARLDLSPSVRHGIVVFRVVRHSPADAAGVLPGDIVTHINGTEVKWLSGIS